MQNVASLATVVPEVELEPLPPAVNPMWAGTLPGVMAGKRPPKGSPRVEFEVTARSAAVAVAVGAD